MGHGNNKLLTYVRVDPFGLFDFVRYVYFCFWCLQYSEWRFFGIVENPIFRA